MSKEIEILAIDPTFKPDFGVLNDVFSHLESVLELAKQMREQIEQMRGIFDDDDGAIQTICNRYDAFNKGLLKDGLKIPAINKRQNDYVAGNETACGPSSCTDGLGGTAELAGEALDRAVYHCEEKKWAERNQWFDDTPDSYDCPLPRPSEFVYDYEYGDEWCPSINWSQAGPIIQREQIQIEPVFGGDWVATNAKGDHWRGNTPLVAAMHCYVGTMLPNAIHYIRGK